jgi:hypothetical protein
MNWNKDNKRKHRYLTENQEGLFELGAPVYKHEKSLGAKRYDADKSLDNFLTQYVKLNGGKVFFEDVSWREKLFRMVEEYKGKNVLNDRYESELDRRNRFEWELKESKNILEKELRKKVSFLCWPGGGKNEFSIEISKKYYLASTVSSPDQIRKRNRFGEDPSIIRRIGGPYLGDEKKSDKFKYLSGLYLYWVIEEFKGNIFHRCIRKFLKACYMIRFGI